MAERELAIVMRARDLASRAIANVNRQLGSIGGHAQRGLANAARNVERGVVVVGAAAIGGLVYATKAAGAFEAQMNTLNTIAMTTGDAFSGALGEIGDRIRKLARDTGTPLEELTTAYYDLLSAGIKTADAQNVLTAANTLAIGGLASTAETIDLLTTAINSYGGDATKAAQYADAFAVAIERGKVTAAEIAASFAQVGPLAAAMGVNIDEISALLANMTARGTPAAEAFTQIRAAMIALQRQTPEMKRVLKELGIANVEAEVAARGLTPVYEDLAKKADELGIPFIKLTGRVEGTMFALANTGSEFEAFQGHLEAVRQGTGTAQEQMEQRQQGLNFQMARMRAIINDVAITLGSKLIPKIVPLLQKLAETIEANQDKIEVWAGQVAAGFEKAVRWAMSLDWGAIANSLKAAGSFAKGLVEVFLGLPPWVQTAVVTGWGLNKLTGGALGSIVGSLASGLIKGILGINAGVVNVRGAVVNAPGGGMPVGGGGRGGLAGRAGSLLKWGVGPLAAAFGGWEIGNAIIEPQVAPSRNAMTGSIEAIIARGDMAEIQHALDAVRDGLDTSGTKIEDIPKQMALLLDAGGLRTTLQAQEALLAEALAEQQSTTRASERAAAAARDAIPWAQRQLQEIHNANASEANRHAVQQAADNARHNAQIGKQSEALAAVRAQGATLAQIRDKKTTAVFKATVSITNVISSVVMQQKLHQLRTDVGGGGFI